MNRKKKDSYTKVAALIVMFVAIIAYALIDDAVASPLRMLSRGETVLSPVGVRVVYDVGTHSTFHAYGRGFFQVTRDAVRFTNSAGQNMWETMLSLSAPVFVAQGDVIAVSEFRGRSVDVFNSRGLMYSKQVQHPILNLAVNANGFLALILENGDHYIVEVYNASGQTIMEGSFEDYNVVPFAAAISNDNRYLALALVDLNHVDMRSQIIFSMLNRSDAIHFQNGIFASTEAKENVLIGAIQFMDNNHIVYASNNSISSGVIHNGRYDARWQIEFDNQIDHIAFNDGRTISVAMGDSIINRNPLQIGSVLQYNLQGQLLSTINTGQRVTHLSAGLGGTIIGNNRSFTAVGINGSVLWDYISSREVRQVMFLENTNQALIATPSEANVMRVQRVAQNNGTGIFTEYENDISYEVELIVEVEE